MGSLDKLLSCLGLYTGKGVNHEGQEFLGEFELSPLVNGKGIRVTFVAKSEAGEIFHQEETTIAPNIEGSLSLWTLNNNLPFQYEHQLVAGRLADGAESTYVFRHNDPADGSKFREEISIDLWPNGDVSYRYAWGMPGGGFEDRSGARMVKS